MIVFTVIGAWFCIPLDDPAIPFEVESFDVTEEKSFWSLWIWICGWVLLGSEAVISDVDESINSRFEVTDVAVLFDDKLLDDRVAWDSRVRFRFGDVWSEVDVDVIKSAITYQFSLNCLSLYKSHGKNQIA